MEELEARVTALETQLGVVRQDAAAARILAGGADRDVSAFAAKLETNKKLLEALRETQVGQGKTLDGHSATLKGHGEFLKEHSQTLHDLTGEMRGGFAMLAAGQARITALLEEAGADE